MVEPALEVASTASEKADSQNASSTTVQSKVAPLARLLKRASRSILEKFLFSPALDFGLKAETSTRDFVIRMEANRRRLKAELDAEELRECTFTPRLTISLIRSSRPSVEKKDREQRLATVAEEMNKDLNLKICRRSAELAKTRGNQPVYERLYAGEKTIKITEPSQLPPPPPNDGKKGRRRSTTLYNEAALRESRRGEAAAKLEASIVEQTSHGAKLSRGSQRVYRSFLRRRLQTILSSISGLGDDITFHDFVRFLVAFGLEDELGEGEPQARPNLATRLWTLVKLPKEDISTRSRTVEVLLRLLGGYTDRDPLPNSNQSSDFSLKEFRKEMRKRLPPGCHPKDLFDSSSCSSAKRGDLHSDSTETTTPIILDSSKKMADLVNEELKRAYGVTDHAELMILRKTLARDRLLMKAEEAAETSMRDCTFQPHLASSRKQKVANDSSRTPASHWLNESHGPHAYGRFEELYADGRSREERYVRRAEAAAQEGRRREAAECSFKPDTAATRESKKLASPGKDKLRALPRGCEAAADRMRMARKQRLNLERWRTVRSQEYRPVFDEADPISQRKGPEMQLH
ncbi:hypothetical protein FOL47_004442 [Perkinsus chesapeaki]|uniref:Uncharacterized protein n=1 Tax=Perkinsus chesapeaki TaxID=330153 RepID=A0A7J6M2N8_PERCH|nr:hypothetical protein FOL47_004442 [Perkinsus chesapeaki]